MRRRIGLHSALYLRNTFNPIQKDLLKQQGTFHEVNVTIRKAGENQTAFGIDNLRRRATKATDLAIAAYSQYLSIANCQSFRPGMLDIQGVNSAMKQDGIGGALGRLRLKGMGEKSEKE